MANRLRSVVRAQDLLARPGGDEFTLLIRDVAGDVSAVATDLAGRVIAALREPLHVEGVPLEVRASVGVSTFPARRDHRRGPAVRYADAAMYIAKAGARTASISPLPRNGTGCRPDDGFEPRSCRRRAHRILSERDRVDAFPADRRDRHRRASWPTRRLRAVPRDRRCSVPIACSRQPRRPAGSSSSTGPAAIAAVRRRRSTPAWAATASLFLNVEPSAIGAPCPQEHPSCCGARAERELDLVLEITERALTDRPAELVRASASTAPPDAASRSTTSAPTSARSRCCRWSRPTSSSSTSASSRTGPSTDQAAIVSAVAAERERTGARRAGRGHRDRGAPRRRAHARARRSARAGCGAARARCTPRPARGSAVRRGVAAPRRTGRHAVRGRRRERRTAHATKSLLLPMSHHLEHRRRCASARAP